MVKQFLLGFLLIFILNFSVFAKIEKKQATVSKTSLVKAARSKAPVVKRTRTVSQASKKKQPRKKILKPNKPRTIRVVRKARVKRSPGAYSRQLRRNKTLQQKQEVTPRQQEQKRIQPDNLAIQQQAEVKRRQQEEQQQALLRQQEQERIAQQQRSEIIRKIHPFNLNNYQDIGITDLFGNGHYGQNVTVAVIEGGFYHTLDPLQRPAVGNILIPGVANDWYSRHREQILPPLSFYDPVQSPLDWKFELNLMRGKGFRFSHGDGVLSAVAEAAPQAKILPVQASFGNTDGSFVRALEALSERNDVNIINMSRWLESCVHDEARLNPAVLTALRKCTDRGKIIVLSASNKPIDIPTLPTHNPAVVGDVMAFGANLISDLFNQMTPDDSLRKHTVISGALAPLTNDIASYSVRAGHGPARHNYIATKGEIYSEIHNSLWDGTSASAPYTSGVLADLLSAQPGAPSSKVVEALFESAEQRPHSQHVYGKGLVKGQRALRRLLDE